MPSIDIQLNDYFAAFIRARAGTAPYRDASDVVMAALRLLEEREQRLKEFIAEGDDPDDPGLPVEEVFSKLEAKYRRLADEQENSIQK